MRLEQTEKVLSVVEVLLHQKNQLEQQISSLTSELGDSMRRAQEMEHKNNSADCGVRSWTVTEVTDWIQGLEAGAYARYSGGFRSMRVTGQRLMSLSIEEWEELVPDMKHRIALKCATTLLNDVILRLSGYPSDAGRGPVTEFLKTATRGAKWDRIQWHRDHVTLTFKSIAEADPYIKLDGIAWKDHYHHLSVKIKPRNFSAPTIPSRGSVQQQSSNTLLHSALNAITDNYREGSLEGRRPSWSPHAIRANQRFRHAPSTKLTVVIPGSGEIHDTLQQLRRMTGLPERPPPAEGEASPEQPGQLKRVSSSRSVNSISSTFSNMSVASRIPKSLRSRHPSLHSAASHRRRNSNPASMEQFKTKMGHQFEQKGTRRSPFRPQREATEGIYQSICAMKEYGMKSHEELRYEDIGLDKSSARRRAAMYV